MLLWQRLSLILLVALTVLCGLVLYSKSQLHAAASGKKGRVRRRTTAGPKIHACLCSDDKDLRPAAAAIRSASNSAADPARLVFHFITTKDLAPRAKSLFKEYLEGVKVEVHYDVDLQVKIESLISFRRTSKARRVLASPFNFAPFYLDEYIRRKVKPHRLIYLDTDTLVLGDLAELHDMDLQGHPCAAVKYCLQRWEDYIDFAVLNELGFDGYDPKQCIANRGVFVIDVATWRQENITGKIEDWMGLYRRAKSDLWFGGMSQPPWLLAMNGNFMSIGDEWNCNSLGRDSMSMWESIALRKNGFDHKALRQLEVKFGSYGSIMPYVVTCSDTAKLLHYNGEMKPWVADRLKRTPPACAAPRSLAQDDWAWSASIRLFCEDVRYVRCEAIWSLFMTQEAGCALQDLDSEWAEEDRRWAEQKKEDQDKLEKERKDKEKKQGDEQPKEEEKPAQEEPKEPKKSKKAKKSSRSEDVQEQTEDEG
mmetsp:Transcript_85360/g.219820  ORF Transcript_85360/g.219820 Transcript_85360/m.219820 type:complete len:480 (-) Transcript_85360:26-1465(-)